MLLVCARCPTTRFSQKNTWPTILVITLKLQVLSFPILSQTQLSTRSVVEFKDVQTNFIHHRTSHILNAFLYLILLDYIGLFRRMPMGHRIPSHYTSAGVFNISLWGMGSCVNLSSLHLLASAIGGFHQEWPDPIFNWRLRVAVLSSPPPLGSGRCWSNPQCDFHCGTLPRFKKDVTTLTRQIQTQNPEDS